MTVETEEIDKLVNDRINPVNLDDRQKEKNKLSEVFPSLAMPNINKDEINLDLDFDANEPAKEERKRSQSNDRKTTKRKDSRSNSDDRRDRRRRKRSYSKESDDRRRHNSRRDRDGKLISKFKASLLLFSLNNHLVSQ